MKKMLLFSIGMVLSLTAGMAVSQALMSDDDLLTHIFEKAGVTMVDNNDAKELEALANSELPFQGLYLFMLQNIKNGPRDAAIEEIANRYKYTEDEIKALVLEGDTQGIINKKQEEALEAQAEGVAEQMEAAQAQADADVETFISDNSFGPTTEEFVRGYYDTYERPPLATDLNQPLTTDFLLGRMTEIGDAYDTELEFQQSNRRLAYEAIASEMFMNNELGDSANIDLLYDLDLIHYLLFGELIVWPDRSDEEIDLASEVLQEEEPLELFTVPQAPERVVLAEEALDPYVCYGDEDLAGALNEFNSNPPDTGDALPETEGSIDYSLGSSDETESNSSSSAAGSSGTSSSSSSSSSAVETNPYLVDIGAAFQALDSVLSGFEAPKGNWIRGLPCSEVFCIEVAVIAETEDPEVERENMEAGSFEEDENCIACHTAYIQKRLEDTMSKSLVPSKITMNWFEDATCKEAGSFVNLDLNVYAIKRPIDLDPGDDLDEKADEEIEIFKSSLGPLIGVGDKLGKTKSEQECESILNLGKAAKSERAIDELLDQCQEAATENAAQIQEAFAEFNFNTYSQTTSDLYNQVSSELYTMLLYFQTFQEGIKDTYLNDQAPLSSLLTKGYCK